MQRLEREKQKQGMNKEPLNANGQTFNPIRIEGGRKHRSPPYLFRDGRYGAEQADRVHRVRHFLFAKGQGRRSFRRGDVLRCIVHVDRLLDPWLIRLDLHVHRRFLFLVLLVFDWLARLANHRRRLLVVRFLDNDRFLKRRGTALFVFLVYTETGSRLGHEFCNATFYANRRATPVDQGFSNFRDLWPPFSLSFLHYTWLLLS